jgi:hypothetical protein
MTLRHTAGTLAARTGATSKELMSRLGHASPQAAIVYQHASQDRDRVIAEGLAAMAADAGLAGRLDRFGWRLAARCGHSVSDRDPVPIDGPRIRRAPVPTDAVLVVRGDAGSRAVSRAQAERFLRRYLSGGRYGLSAFYVRSDEEIDDLAESQLQSFPRLALFRITDLEVAGFEVVPTFRTPHVTIAFTGDLDGWLRRLVASRLELRATRTMNQSNGRSVTRRKTVERRPHDRPSRRPQHDGRHRPAVVVAGRQSATRAGHPGRYIVVGEGLATAVAQVVDVEDGIVHVLPLRGSVGANAHRLEPPFIAS